MNGKKEELDRGRGVKTILNSGQEWNLLAQQGQLKTEPGGKGLSEGDAASTLQGYWLE